MPAILVIEDDRAWRILILNLLTRMGHEIITACDGQEGLEKAQEAHSSIALIVLDIVMPFLNGWEVLIALRKDSRTCKIPVVLVAVTEKADADSKLAMSLEADGYYNKDTHISYLKEIVQELLPPQVVLEQAA